MRRESKSTDDVFKLEPVGLVSGAGYLSQSALNGLAFWKEEKSMLQKSSDLVKGLRKSDLLTSSIDGVVAGVGVAYGGAVFLGGWYTFIAKTVLSSAYELSHYDENSAGWNVVCLAGLMVSGGYLVKSLHEKVKIPSLFVKQKKQFSDAMSFLLSMGPDELRQAIAVFCQDILEECKVEGDGVAIIIDSVVNRLLPDIEKVIIPESVSKLAGNAITYSHPILGILSLFYKEKRDFYPVLLRIIGRMEDQYLLSVEVFSGRLFQDPISMPTIAESEKVYSLRIKDCKAFKTKINDYMAKLEALLDLFKKGNPDFNQVHQLINYVAQYADLTDDECKSFDRKRMLNEFPTKKEAGAFQKQALKAVGAKIKAAHSLAKQQVAQYDKRIVDLSARVQTYQTITDFRQKIDAQRQRWAECLEKNKFETVATGTAKVVASPFAGLFSGIKAVASLNRKASDVVGNVTSVVTTPFESAKNAMEEPRIKAAKKLAVLGFVEQDVHQRLRLPKQLSTQEQKSFAAALDIVSKDVSKDLFYSYSAQQFAALKERLHKITAMYSDTYEGDHCRSVMRSLKDSLVAKIDSSDSVDALYKLCSRQEVFEEKIERNKRFYKDDVLEPMRQMLDVFVEYRQIACSTYEKLDEEMAFKSLQSRVVKEIKLYKSNKLSFSGDGRKYKFRDMVAGIVAEKFKQFQDHFDTSSDADRRDFIVALAALLEGLANHYQQDHPNSTLPKCIRNSTKVLQCYLKLCGVESADIAQYNETLSHQP